MPTPSTIDAARPNVAQPDMTLAYWIQTRRRAGGLLRVVAAAALLAVACLSGPIAAQAAPATDGKPYDDRLMRLAEILGAVHYLRELCSAGDGQLWRDRMQDLLTSEGSSALRRMRLTRSFNQGYRSYSRTYISCTPSAQAAINRFLVEGTQLSDTLVKSIP